MGCGNSVMLVTVLSMTADMIGIDKVKIRNIIESMAVATLSTLLESSLKPIRQLSHEEPSKKLDTRVRAKVVFSAESLPCVERKAAETFARVCVFRFSHVFPLGGRYLENAFKCIKRLKNNNNN